MKINHDIQLSDGKLKHFLNINNLPKSIIEDIINRAEDFMITLRLLNTLVRLWRVFFLKLVLELKQPLS